ncbi:MAG: hypothetical protein K2X38_02130 [Gemmataceae bacterium]|nr:hypothetical protein [Gemmataceae bacterium]
MALIRGTLPYPRNMQENPVLHFKNHYLNHDYLGDEIARFDAVMHNHNSYGDCMCCGRMPDNTLWQLEVQSQPDQRWFQIGIPRCKQILAAALRVRERATSNPALQRSLAAAEGAIGEIPRTDEIKLMGTLLRAKLANAADVARLNLYLATL